MGSESVDVTEVECGCGPSPSERRAFWPAVVNRRTAIGVGALAVAAASVFAAPQLPPAYAASYPSWDDVVRAKRNQAAKSQEVSRIQGLIAGLTSNVEATRQVAEQRANEFYQAQQEYYDAAQRADDLQMQADEQAGIAQDSANKAGRLAAQLYRDGGDDTSLELFFAGTAAGADDLLARLGQMDKLLERNRDVYAAAVTARDSAQSLSDQAVVARTARDRLQKEAEKKMAQSQAAADAAQAALDAQAAHLSDLQAQLAALKDTTAKTVASYKAGVEAARKAKLERERKAREEAERIAREQGGGSVTGGGWCRPSSGWHSSGYGSRPVICAGGYCSGGFHHGVDLAASCGSAIFAAHSGTVVYAGYNGGLGNYIKIDHGGGLGTGYGHIKTNGIYVRHGQWVSAGQLIAAEGSTGNSTGCHLHFETYINNVPVNPVGFMANYGISV